MRPELWVSLAGTPARAGSSSRPWRATPPPLPRLTATNEMQIYTCNTYLMLVHALLTTHSLSSDTPLRSNSHSRKARRASVSLKESRFEQERARVQALIGLCLDSGGPPKSCLAPPPQHPPTHPTPLPALRLDDIPDTQSVLPQPSNPSLPRFIALPGHGTRFYSIFLLPIPSVKWDGVVARRTNSRAQEKQPKERGKQVGRNIERKIPMVQKGKDVRARKIVSEL